MGRVAAGSMSHSYLYVKKLREVWPAFLLFRDVFKSEPE